LSAQQKLKPHYQQFVIALILTISIIGFLFVGSYKEWIDKEVMMFMLGSVTTAFILSVQFYFRRGTPQ